ncbi:hypothetical protein ASPBRDRAFT_61389 [Aspergillus brasiliensis CBS 101740]|uniref:AAA+ ATPase domain-containing protein n=1 Tax=Aspergillus brasiliensis (strain CBS 101740 / IMI 381727 / IBT 21946) TaxID=767769 RepID=A0A1L9V1Y1_ASPBC|nr:hypothetical protein ASPBRDRAFT_61389 [Aspergillus brasiliensis CBS 101740]
MRPKRREDFTIAIICTLPLEGEAVEALFDETYDRSCKLYGKQQGDTNSYINGRLGRHNVVLCCLPKMGNGSAASVASSLQTSYTGIQLALVVGICGGAPRPGKDQELFLGDVVISDSAIEYDFGRQYPSGFQRKTGVKDTLGRPNREIRTLLNAMTARRSRGELEFEIMHHLGALQQVDYRWRHPGIDDSLFDSHYSHIHHDPSVGCLCLDSDSVDGICDEALEEDCSDIECDKSRIIRGRKSTEMRQVSIHIGTVGSADTTMKSGQYRDRLNMEEGFIGFETAGAGVWDTFPCIIIKGVSDYADGHRSKPWEVYAAATGASAAKALLDYWRPRGPEDISVTGHFVVPFARNQHFVGRQDELDRLEELTSTPENSGRLAITGLGGVGKTQIALELAYRMHANDPECSIFWISCTSHEAIQKACMTIARLIGIQDANPTSEEQQVKHYFSQTNDKWLLILDGTDDMEMCLDDSSTASPLRNLLPSNPHGRIIFTNRNRKLAVKLASHDVIHVRELDEMAGVELLQKSLIQQNPIQDRAVAAYLVNQLAFLPLAITQAAAYINENGIEVYDYLLLLGEPEEDVVELLSEDFQADGRYEDSVNPIALTWLGSFRQIEKVDPLAAEYLSLLACLDQRSIPELFFPRPASRKKMVDALGLLSAYSFVAIRPGTRFITLHRLVHLAVRHWLKSEGRLSLYIHKAAERLNEVLSNDRVNERYRKQCVPHAESLLRDIYLTAVQTQWTIQIRSDGDESVAEGERLLVQAKTSSQICPDEPEAVTYDGTALA